MDAPADAAACPLLTLIRRRYTPEAVAHVGKLLLDRCRFGRMASRTHVADQVFVPPRSPRSCHCVLAAQAAHAGRGVTSFGDHGWLETCCVDIARRLPSTPRVDTPLTMRASAAPAISVRMVWSPCSAAPCSGPDGEPYPTASESSTVKREAPDEAVRASGLATRRRDLMRLLVGGVVGSVRVGRGWFGSGRGRRLG